MKEGLGRGRYHASEHGCDFEHPEEAVNHGDARSKLWDAEDRYCVDSFVPRIGIAELHEVQRFAAIECIDGVLDSLHLRIRFTPKAVKDVGDCVVRWKRRSARLVHDTARQR